MQISIHDFCSKPEEYRTKLSNEEFEYKQCLCSAFQPLESSNGSSGKNKVLEKIETIIEGIFTLQGLEMIGGTLALQKIAVPLLKSAAAAAATQGALIEAATARAAQTGISKIAAYMAEMSTFIFRYLGKLLFGAAELGFRAASFILDDVILGAPLAVIQIISLILDMLNVCEMSLTQSNISLISSKINETFVNQLISPTLSSSYKEGTCTKKYTQIYNSWPYYYPLENTQSFLEDQEFGALVTTYQAKYLDSLIVNSDGLYINHNADVAAAAETSDAAAKSLAELASGGNPAAAAWIERWLWLIIVIIIGAVIAIVFLR